MRRLLFGILLLLSATIVFTTCSDTGTGPDPDNEGGGENEQETPTYNVSISSSPSDGGTAVPSDTTVEEGTELSLQAEPSPEYTFSHWSGDVSSTSQNSLSLTVDQSYSIEANFDLKNYELTVNKEGKGTVTEEVLEQKSKEYEHGTVVELIAKPKADWKFVEWKGAVSGSENPKEITIEEPEEVTAIFEKKEYTLTVEKDGEGAVAEEVVKQKSSEDYEAGTVIRLTGNPATGWVFEDWKGPESVASSRNPIEFEVDSNVTVTANFTRKDYLLSVRTEGPGSVTGIPEEKPKYNEKIELTAVPRDERHQFAEWKGDISSTENPVTITMNSDKEVLGVFEDATHELTINTEGKGEVVEENLMGKGYELGTNVKLTANPEQGWAFEKWKGDLTGSENPLQVTATEPKEVTAVFGKKEIKLSHVSSQTLYGKPRITLPIEVQITDQADNGISDVNLSYQVTDGNGTISPTQVTTDENGEASATLQLPDGMNSTTVKVQIQNAPYTITKEEITFQANTLTELDEWLNNHETITEVINWEISNDSTANYTEWTEEMKNELNEIYVKVVNNNVDTDQYPPENLYSQDTRVSYPTELKPEDAWRLYLMNVAQSLAVERNNMVNWSILSSDYSEEDLRVLLDARVMLELRDEIHEEEIKYKVVSSQKDEGTSSRPNFVPVGYGRVMPSHPQIAMDFFRNKNIIDNTRKETIYRLISWSSGNLAHFSGSFSERQNILDHWGYLGALPVNKIIEGTNYRGDADDEYKIEHFTAGCHGTNDFYISVLRNLNIPVRYIRKGGHSTPHFPVEDLYLSHGDDPYGSYASKPAIHPKELLISQQTWNEWFANKSYEEAQDNIGRRGMELSLEHISHSLLNLYCEDKSSGVPKKNGEVYEAYSRYYSLSELEDMNLWQKMDNKLSEIGGCQAIDIYERVTYYQH